MGGKFSRAEQETSAGDKSPGALSRRSISSRLSTRSRRTTKSTEDGGASTLPRNFERGRSLSKRFRKSCRNWAAKKGIVDQSKSGRKDAGGAEEEAKREQEEAVARSSEPEEVMEEDDVTEEPEMDVAVIVAELVVEAHKRKLASRAQSKEALAEKANDNDEQRAKEGDDEIEKTKDGNDEIEKANTGDDEIETADNNDDIETADNDEDIEKADDTDDMKEENIEDKTKEKLLQDSERCEEEALATLVETEAVVEVQVAPEEGGYIYDTTSSVLEIETETVSAHSEDGVPAGAFEESQETDAVMKEVDEVESTRGEEDREGLGNDPVDEVADDNMDVTDEESATWKEDQDQGNFEARETNEDQGVLLNEEYNSTGKSCSPETAGEDSWSAEKETVTETETESPPLGQPGFEQVECQTVVAGNQVAVEIEEKGDQEVHIEQEVYHEDNNSSVSEDMDDEINEDEGMEINVDATEEEGSVTEIECRRDFSSDSIKSTSDSVNLDQKDLSHNDQEERRNSLNNQNESDECFEETSVQNPATPEQDDETSYALNSDLPLAQSPPLEHIQQERSGDDETGQIEMVGETSSSQDMHAGDADTGSGLIGSVELRAPDSFVSGMTEAAYVRTTPPPSILVPTVSREQEEDNTTFIGLEVDHDREEEKAECINNVILEKTLSDSENKEDRLIWEVDHENSVKEPSLIKEVIDDNGEAEEDESAEGGENDLEKVNEQKENVEKENDADERNIATDERESEQSEGEAEDEDRLEDDVEDDDEGLIAMMARLGCEKIFLKQVTQETDPAVSNTLSDDESVGLLMAEPPAASGGSQQMQEDHQPPFSSCQHQTDSMLVLNSSYEEEEEDCDEEGSEFFSEDEDDLINDGRVVLENIEEEDEDESVSDADEAFPSRGPGEIHADDRGEFSCGLVVARQETEDDTDGELGDSTDSERGSTRASSLNGAGGAWTENRLEPISMESVVTVIDRDADERGDDEFLAEGNKISAMEFLMLNNEDLEFFPNEEEMQAREEKRRGREESRSRPTSDFRSSFESFLSISSDGEDDSGAVGQLLTRMRIEEAEEEEEEVSSDEGIDDNEDEKAIKNVVSETKIRGKIGGEGQLQDQIEYDGSTSCQ